MAVAWGDDIGLRRLMDPLDKADPDAVVAAARALEQGEDREQGARAAAHLLSPAGKALADQMCLAHRDVGRRFATRLGLTGAVGEGLGQVYERWDGTGMPGPLVGEQIPLVVRVVHVAYVAEGAFREGGLGLAVEVVRRRSGATSTRPWRRRCSRTRGPSSTPSLPSRSGTGCWRPSPSRGVGSTSGGSTRCSRRSRTSWTSSRRTPSATPRGWQRGRLTHAEWERVATLALLEPLLAFAVAPATAQFVLDTAAESYRRLGEGDPAGAVDGWLEAAFDPGYRDLLDGALPGAFEQAVADADAPFAVEVPSLQSWPRGPDDVRRVAQPALAVLGADGTWPGFRETQEALCSWLPRGERLLVPQATHLLQIANPRAVAEGLASFLARHPLRGAV
jgi:hypothetical protein